VTVAAPAAAAAASAAASGIVTEAGGLEEVAVSVTGGFLDLGSRTEGRGGERRRRVVSIKRLKASEMRVCIVNVKSMLLQDEATQLCWQPGLSYCAGPS
jgi:hypothetical protein